MQTAFGRVTNRSAFDNNLRFLRISAKEARVEDGVSGTARILGSLHLVQTLVPGGCPVNETSQLSLPLGHSCDPRGGTATPPRRSSSAWSSRLRSHL